MTILWDGDQGAAGTYHFVLGDGVQLVAHATRVVRALEENQAEHLVVIGPDIPTDAACELAEALRVQRPAAGVLLLRHRLDVAVLAQALRSGVREVVQADDHNAIAEAVRRSETLSAQLAGDAGDGVGEGKVVTVFSAKGGVGKTTLSTNLATYLASTGARTLLVDLDLMFGDVAISLQLVPAGSVIDLVPMTGHLDRAGLQSVVVRHEPSGLDVVAAPVDPGDAERIPAQVVLELLRVARTTYDYVLVDTPPSFTEHALASFDVSDLVLLIATLDIPAVKNLRIAMNTLDALGAPQENSCVVLNRADLKVGLGTEEVEAALKQRIAGEIPNSLSVPTSINRGVPVILDEPRSGVALAIRQFADHEIRQRFGEVIQNGSKRNFGLLRSKR